MLHSKFKINDYSINLSKIKTETKKLLFTNQQLHNAVEWYPSNLDIRKPNLWTDADLLGSEILIYVLLYKINALI